MGRHQRAGTVAALQRDPPHGRGDTREDPGTFTETLPDDQLQKITDEIQHRIEEHHAHAKPAIGRGSGSPTRQRLDLPGQRATQWRRPARPRLSGAEPVECGYNAGSNDNHARPPTMSRFNWEDPLLLDEQLSRRRAHGARCRPQLGAGAPATARTGPSATRRPIRRSSARWANWAARHHHPGLRLCRQFLRDLRPRRA